MRRDACLAVIEFDRKPCDTGPTATWLVARIRGSQSDHVGAQQHVVTPPLAGYPGISDRPTRDLLHTKARCASVTRADASRQHMIHLLRRYQAAVCECKSLSPHTSGLYLHTCSRAILVLPWSSISVVMHTLHKPALHA